LETNKKYKSHLKIKSRTKNLSLIRNFISEKAAAVNFGSKDIADIILAVDEACTNIIKHAYNSDPEGKINISIEAEAGKFTITIEDYGHSFNPDKVPVPDLQRYHNEKKVGGLGIYLMKALMDEVKYVSVPGKYNRVILSKNLNKN